MTTFFLPFTFLFFYCFLLFSFHKWVCGVFQLQITIHHQPVREDKEKNHHIFIIIKNTPTNLLKYVQTYIQLLTKIFCVHIFTKNFRVLTSQSLNYLTTTNFIFFGHKTYTVRSILFFPSAYGSSLHQKCQKRGKRTKFFRAKNYFVSP